MLHHTTLADIAKELGVSVPTVHRALTGQGRVNEKTRQAVLEVAKKMNYVHHADADTPAMRIAFVCPDNFFYRHIISGVDTAVKTHAQDGLSIQYFLEDDYNTQSQIEYLRQILQSDLFHGVILSPTHAMLLNPLIQGLSDKGIPTVTVNNDVPQSSRICFVGEDSYMSGQMAAELYTYILPGDASIAVMQSMVSAEGLKKRVDGFCDGVQASGKCNLIGKIDFYDNIQNATETAKLAILNTKIDGIFVNSMIGTIGILRAMNEYAADAPPFLIGYDMNEEIKQGIQSGVIFGTLLQSPYWQGYYAVQALYQTLKSGKAPVNSTLFTPTQLILRSNLSQLKSNRILELGNWQRSDMDTEILSSDNSSDNSDN